MEDKTLELMVSTRVCFEKHFLEGPQDFRV